MKTGYWIALLAVILAVCIGLSIPLLLPGEDAAYAEITSGGQILKIVDLRIDQEFTVETPDGGVNTVTVRDGKIGVTAANCPDHYCMDRGMCGSGAQIVCLPNKLIIRFEGPQMADTVVG